MDIRYDAQWFGDSILVIVMLTSAETQMTNGANSNQIMTFLSNDLGIWSVYTINRVMFFVSLINTLRHSLISFQLRVIK